MHGDHDPKECSENFLSGAREGLEVDEEVHHLLRGRFQGGFRFHPEMGMDHSRGLAAVMTWKTATATRMRGF